ncbi:ubiquitin domain-containing protein 7SL RNA1-like isoform X1 [Punica granatum]|uniref:Ubiquitin domain-containing protein 7SL RNA1-like isoform X1 n=1 Tax=Punica granatum TaxID=22663 RepID=A0A6P8DS59_PUNGR|nr:ubiquitin domain-containing protein 7SL RNA1-like isoform X1 [Punica granatum]
MDVIFERQRGRPFSIEVGFFDTVQEIKEKIQKYHGIPISRQTLLFKSQVLQDERDVEYCEILQNSHIQLIINPELNSKEPPPTPTKQIQLNIKFPSSNSHFPLEMNVSDAISHVKEKIHEIDQSIPLNIFVLHCNGKQLQDHLSVGESELFNNSEIEVIVRNNSQTTPGTAATTNNKKLRIMVLTKCGTRKIPVEVNAGDNVGELRRELQRLQQRMNNFALPPEGYFFIYRQNVMDEDRSFRWHHVGQGDTIEIFNGSVTGGS